MVRLAVQAPKEGWDEWIATVIGGIDSGDMATAANMLSNCTLEPSDPAIHTAEYREGYSRMFKHPLVLKHAPALWDFMIPQFFPKALASVLAEVEAAGWKVPASNTTIANLAVGDHFCYAKNIYQLKWVDHGGDLRPSLPWYHIGPVGNDGIECRLPLNRKVIPIPKTAQGRFVELLKEVLDEQ